METGKNNMLYTVIISKAGTIPLFGPMLVKSAVEARAILLDELTRHLETLRTIQPTDQAALIDTNQAMTDLRAYDLSNPFRVVLPAGSDANLLTFKIFTTDDEISTTTAEDLKRDHQTPFPCPPPDNLI
jgi:hypothetical protein